MYLYALFLWFFIKYGLVVSQVLFEINKGDKIIEKLIVHLTLCLIFFNLGYAISTQVLQQEFGITRGTVTFISPLQT